MEIVKKEKTIEHPMEDVLGIQGGTTIVEFTEIVPAVPVPAPQYDPKDDEIEQKIEEVYAFAMSKVATVADQIDLVEGKYKARLGEVTSTMLSVALGAIREKRELKKHKDTVAVKTTDASTPTNVTNNNVILTRNELLEMLNNKNKR